MMELTQSVIPPAVSTLLVSAILKRTLMPHRSWHCGDDQSGSSNERPTLNEDGRGQANKASDALSKMFHRSLQTVVVVEFKRWCCQIALAGAASICKILSLKSKFRLASITPSRRHFLAARRSLCPTLFIILCGYKIVTGSRFSPVFDPNYAFRPGRPLVSASVLRPVFSLASQRRGHLSLSALAP